MKIGLQFIFGLFAAIFLVAFLSWSYFQPAKQAPVQAVEDLGQYEPQSQGEGFGEPRCDRIIPIGEPLDATVKLLAVVLGEQKSGGIYTKNASGNLQSILAQLSKDQKYVCDFTKCLPVALDFGPKFTLELQALVKTITLSGHAPIPANKDCAGSPCPDLGDTQFTLTDENDPTKGYTSDTGPIGALTGWLAAVEGSRDRVRAIFEEPTVTVTADISQGDLGQMITEPEAIRRRAANAAEIVKQCSLSEKDKKMVLSGRLGDKYPMTCRDAIDAGQYWPMPWSEMCKAECDDGEGSEKCIKCLQKKTPDWNKASILGRLNYEIYNECASDFFNDADGKMITVDACYNKTTGEWGMSEACVECLCTNREMSAIPQAAEDMSDPQMKITRERITDDACLAFLCGGSSRNWTCCHQAPIEFTGDMGEAMHHPELGPGSENYNLPNPANPDEILPPLVGDPEIDISEAEEFVLSAYAPPCFCEGRCTNQQSQVGLGDIATYSTNIPHGSRVTVVSRFENANYDKEKKVYNRGGSTTYKDSFTIVGNTTIGVDSGGAPYDISFCACDTGGDIKNRRIDVWMPNHDTAMQFGTRFAKVVWEPDSTCCKPKATCCINPKATGCKTTIPADGEKSIGLRCSINNECCCHDKVISEWNYLFKQFGLPKCPSPLICPRW